MGHALMENRNGLIVDACLTPADGHAERVAALHMIEPRAAGLSKSAQPVHESTIKRAKATRTRAASGDTPSGRSG